MPKKTPSRMRMFCGIQEISWDDERTSKVFVLLKEDQSLYFFLLMFVSVSLSLCRQKSWEFVGLILDHKGQ